MWPKQCPLSMKNVIVMVAAEALPEWLQVKPLQLKLRKERQVIKALLEDMVRDLKIPNQSLKRYLGKMLMYPLKRTQVGVNYYASTTKAAQAAQSASHKQLAWDWLSSSSDKQPLKDTLKSIRYQCECTSEAAYNLVETAGNILEELKCQKTIMSEQCTLLKTIAANQVELSKLMKATGATEGKGQSPLSGGVPNAGASCGTGTPTALPPVSPGVGHQPYGSYGTPSTPPPSFMPFVPPPHVAAAPIVGRFWSYQPVAAPNYEPDESRNPPSAAYAS